MLRVEDIHHRPDTKDRLDKAAATQLVFEDAMIHVVDHLLRATGANRLVLTGGVALNAVGNMRLLEHFDEAWFANSAAAQGPPASVGAADAGRRRRDHRRGLAVRASGRRAARRADDARVLLRHCRRRRRTSRRRLRPTTSPRSAIGDISTPEGRDAVADLMAFIVAHKRHRSRCIRARPRPARARSAIARSSPILAIPKRASGSTSASNTAKRSGRWRRWRRWKRRSEYFDLLEGASDADYNAYNYMVLTARSKPHARDKIPAVIHADGTGRIQIVRAEDDPLTYAYLKALGRHIGVEMSRQHLVQCRRSDRADPEPGDRHAAPLQGSRCGVDGRRRRRGHRGMAWRRARQRPVYRLVFGMGTITPANSRLIAEPV